MTLEDAVELALAKGNPESLDERPRVTLLRQGEG
jgi:hypothetical protein